MGRPKKEEPNHGKYYEVKATIGKEFDGKPIRKSFYSLISKDDAKKQADEWKINKEVAERAGEAFIDKDVTFAVWAKKWLETYKKPNVDENTYRMTYKQTVNNHLIPYFGKSDLKSIKPIDIKTFFNSKDNFSKSVLSKLHMCLNGIFESAIENDVCYKNPVKHISVKSKRRKNIKKVYTDKQIEMVIITSIICMPEVAVLLETGLRRGELLGLMWDDFDEKNKTISVNRSIADIPNGIKTNPPKWNSYRDIPLTDRSVKILKSITHNGDYIFPMADGTPHKPNQWSKNLKRYMNNKIVPQGAPYLTAHELRHTFGTALRRRGVDIYTISKVMGHKDIKMTAEIYVHNEIEPLRKGLKLGTGVVQLSYGRKFKIKQK